MKFFKFIFLVLSGLLVPFQIFGQVSLKKTGQSTMDFLLVSISPKASSLGEAYTAFGTGAESMFYNPAALVEANNKFDVTVNYTQWIADIKYLGGAIAYNAGNMGSVGLSFLTVDYGTINATRLDPTLITGGGVRGYIDDGPMQNVGAYSVGLTYAKAISTRFMIGGTVKLVGQNLGENNFGNGDIRKNNATKLAFDAGVKYYTGFKDFRFGMAIRNFASNIRREQNDEQLPLTFSMGAAIDVMQIMNPDINTGKQNLTLAVDFLHSNSYSERVNMGLEYKFMNMLSIRGGYQTNRDIMSWSAGIGLNTAFAGNYVEVNYSFSKMENFFSDVNRFSVEFAF
jgi:hypothetical protein